MSKIYFRPSFPQQYQDMHFLHVPPHPHTQHFPQVENVRHGRVGLSEVSFSHFQKNPHQHVFGEDS